MITTICACTNAFAVGDYDKFFYPTTRLEGCVKDNSGHIEVFIKNVCNDDYKKNWDGVSLSDWEIFFKEEREISKLQDISDVRKVCCEGIVYECIPGTKKGTCELKIFGTPGCNPILRKSPLYAFSCTPHMEYHFVAGDRRPCQGKSLVLLQST